MHDRRKPIEIIRKSLDRNEVVSQSSVFLKNSKIISMKLQYNPEKLDELLPYGNDSRFGELTVEGQNQYQKEKKEALRYIKRKVNNE